MFNFRNQIVPIKKQIYLRDLIQAGCIKNSQIIFKIINYFNEI